MPLAHGSTRETCVSVSNIFGVFATQFVLALFTVYLFHELKVPGPLKEKTRPKTNASFQTPGGQNAVRAPAAGMRSGRGVAGR
jgi:hypothetical protein